jgi:hypothetical protein
VTLFVAEVISYDEVIWEESSYNWCLYKRERTMSRATQRTPWGKGCRDGSGAFTNQNITRGNQSWM